MTSSPAALRVARALVVAGVVLGVSVTAHVAAGGSAPGWPLALVLAALLGAGCLAVTRREVGFGESVVLIGAAQLAVHTLPGLLHALGDSSGGGHHHAVGRADPAVADSLLMLGAHLAATMLAALLLAVGDRALWAVLGWLAPLLRLPAVVSVPSTSPGLASWPPALPRIAHPVLRSVRRRGPPAYARTSGPLVDPGQLTVAVAHVALH